MDPQGSIWFNCTLFGYILHSRVIGFHLVTNSPPFSCMGATWKAGTPRGPLVENHCSKVCLTSTPLRVSYYIAYKPRLSAHFYE